MNFYHDVIKGFLQDARTRILKNIAEDGSIYPTQEEAAAALHTALIGRLASVSPNHRRALLTVDHDGDEGGALVSRLAMDGLSAQEILGAIFEPDICTKDIVWVRKLERLYETFEPYSEGLSALSQLVWLHFEERLPYLKPLDAQGFVIYPGQLFFDHTDPAIEAFVEEYAGTMIDPEPSRG